MRRVGVRLVMAIVGVTFAVSYLAAAYLGVLGARWLWVNRPSLPVLLASLVVGSVVVTYVSYRVGTSQLLAALETTRIPRSVAPGLHRRIDRLTARMDVERPDVFVAAMHAPNAIAVGGAQRGAVVLDRSLFELLSPAELEAIIAHELVHLERNDTLLQAVVHGTANVLVGVLSVILLPAVIVLSGLTRGFAWLRGRPRDRSGPFATAHRGLVGGLVAVVVLTTLLIRVRSRRLEFAVDDRAVSVTGDPLALARALRKIGRAQEPTWVFAPLSTNRETNDTIERWFATHPPIEERIERLRKRAAQQQADGDASTAHRPNRVPIE